MTTQQMNTIIDTIANNIKTATAAMNAILVMSNVKLPEELTGTNADAWNRLHTERRVLCDYMARIESILNSSAQYIANNLL